MMRQYKLRIKNSTVIALVARIIAIIAAMLLLMDLFFHFEERILYWNVFRYLLLFIVIIVYVGMMIQSYTAGNRRKLRELILVAVILFMVSVLTFLLS